MKLLTKLKKAALFIMKQCKKILRTVFQPHFYDDKRSCFNSNFDLFFEYFYLKQMLLFLLNSFSELNLLIFFRFIHKEHRFYSIYQIRETRNTNLSLILFIASLYYFLSTS